MSDSKRDPLERVGSTFSDDIETICAQIGFDPSLYIEFPRKRGSLSLAPEAVSAPGPAPEPEAVPASAPAVNQAAQPAVAVNPAVAETPAASTPAVQLPAPAINGAAKQPPASEIAEQTQLQQAVHSSWTGLSSAAAAPVHTRVPASSAVPTRTAQPLYPPRPVRPAQPLPIARPPGVPNVAPDAPAPAPPVQRQLAVQGLRAGLRALLEELGGEERSTEQRPQRRARALVMTPAVSGMGCTTLTATLARYF